MNAILNSLTNMIPPALYTARVTMPLPDDKTIASVVGASYDSSKTLNVVKMLAGIEDMYPAMIGVAKDVFGTRRWP